MISPQKILDFLDTHSVVYTVTHHAPTITSEDSARERGEEMKIGAKALLLKYDKGFVICVIPADRRLNTGAVRQYLHTKKLRFVSPDELTELTGLTKGAMPPFGNLMGIEMIVDPAQFDNEYIAFNAASLTTSVKMKSADYRQLICPTEESISILT